MNHIIRTILPPKRRGMRAVVVFDDGSTKKYLPQTVADQGLFVGMELTDAELAALEKANAALSAKQRAVRIISAAAVSKGDLQRRLTQKGEDPEDAKNAVAWLSELKLLDDTETARQIVARGAARGYGAERVKQMLYEKRVPRQYWEEALAAMPDMSEALTDFLRKRLGEDPDEKTLRSASAAALRRGYTWPQVREALERLRNPNE